MWSRLLDLLLLGLILEDENIFTYRRRYVDERKRILDAISKQELHISKARKYFSDEKIDLDDFSKLKKEYNEILGQLNYQLSRVSQRIADCDFNNNMWPNFDFNVLQSYKEQDIKGKRDILDLFRPTSINLAEVNIDSLKINVAVAMVVEYRKRFDRSSS